MPLYNDDDYIPFSGYKYKTSDKARKEAGAMATKQDIYNKLEEVEKAVADGVPQNKAKVALCKQLHKVNKYIEALGPEDEKELRSA